MVENQTIMHLAYVSSCFVLSFFPYLLIECSNGEHQENSKVICEEWFFYPDNRHCTGDACQPTSAMISWMRSRGYTDLTKKGACAVTNAPWPLYNNNAIRVAGVCQAICNWCPDGHAPLGTGPATEAPEPTTPVKPVTEDPNAGTIA